MMILRTKRIWFLLFTLLLTASTAVWARYPDREIKMIVPYGPGGGADLGSRVMASFMEKFLGQQMVSMYKPGGGGSLGAVLASRAPADGYTVLVGSPTPLVLAPIVQKLPYKLDDFEFVGNYGCIPIWLAVKSDSKWQTLKQFIADAKKPGAKMTVGSYGMHTQAEVVIRLLNKDAGINLIHVPFKSSGEALTNVLAKHVDAAVVSGSGGLVESGAVRILAAAVSAPLSGLPNVPTFAQLGYPITLHVCYSFVVPKGTPKGIVETLYRAQTKAFESGGKEITKKLRSVDIWAAPSTPKEARSEAMEDYKTLLKMFTQLGEAVK